MSASGGQAYNAAENAMKALSKNPSTLHSYLSHTTPSPCCLTTSHPTISHTTLKASKGGTLPRLQPQPTSGGVASSPLGRSTPIRSLWTESAVVVAVHWESRHVLQNVNSRDHRSPYPPSSTRRRMSCGADISTTSKTQRGTSGASGRVWTQLRSGQSHLSSWSTSAALDANLVRLGPL